MDHATAPGGFRKTLRRVTFVLAAVGIAAELYFAAEIGDSFGNITTYIVVFIVLLGGSEANSFLDKASGQERYNKKRWKFAFWLGKQMDILAFIMVVVQMCLSWIYLRP